MCLLLPPPLHLPAPCLSSSPPIQLGFWRSRLPPVRQEEFEAKKKAKPAAKAKPKPKPAEPDSSDDDVPLAKRQK